MNELVPISIQLDDATIIEGSLQIKSTDGLELTGTGKFDRAIKAIDLFEALKELRRGLEDKNCKILCNGARANVIASGMSRSMGGGRKAYVVTLGQAGSRDSLVDIFDYAEPDLIASVREQEAFHAEWFASLK